MQHLLQLLAGIILWIDPPDAISNAIACGKSERLHSCTIHSPFLCCMSCLVPYVFSGWFSEMLDGCRALLSVATVTTLPVFDELLKSIRFVV